MEARKTDLPFVTEHLTGLANLFADRNAVYKDNFRMVGRIMKAMFPQGITLETEEDHNKFHLFMLAIVKLSRYVINYRGGHKDSIDDMIVYLSMVAALDDEALNGHPFDAASLAASMETLRSAVGGAGGHGG